MKKLKKYSQGLQTLSLGFCCGWSHNYEQGETQPNPTKQQTSHKYQVHSDSANWLVGSENILKHHITKDLKENKKKNRKRNIFKANVG